MKLFLLLALAVASDGRLTGGDGTEMLVEERLLGQGNNGGNNGGQGNKGKTTLSEEFLLFSLSNTDTCFDSLSFCDHVFTNAYQYASDNDYGAAQATAYATFQRDVGCEAASMALSRVKATLVMEGEFSMSRHGNHGAVTNVDLETNIKNSHIAYVHSDAFANNTADVEAYVFAQGYISPEICRYVNTQYYYPYYYRQRLCGYASSYSRANADASASSLSSSSATALSRGEGKQELGVHVEGKNLQSFHATVAAGASNFVSVSANAYSEAFADVYTNVYAHAYAQVCHQYQKRYRYSSYWSTYSSYCQYGNGNAQVNPNEALAEAFAEAAATASANTQYTAVIQADFVNEKGNDDTFSLLRNGFASATAIAHCTAT